MERIILIGLIGQLVCVIAAALILQRKWRPAMLEAEKITVVLKKERAYSKVLEEKVRSLEHDVRTAAAEALYWERLTRKFEDEVMKIATGR